MSTLVHLATADGLLSVDLQEGTVARAFDGQEAIAVASGGDHLHVAVEGTGIHRRHDGDWEAHGLASSTIWVVAADDDGATYVGVEPAALWRVGDDEPVELTGLAAVDGYADWHSPWGPADLSAVVVDGARLIVGVEVGGVAVSHDRGDTWQGRNQGLYEDVHNLVADGPVLLASTGVGCFRSLDEGGTWAAEHEGIDRGYTQGLTRSGSDVIVSSASGPPPLWESGGPEAAIFRAGLTDEPLVWDLRFDSFSGNVGRHALDARGDLVVAGTNEGELVVSPDGGVTFGVFRDDLPPVNAVAVERST